MRSNLMAERDAKEPVVEIHRCPIGEAIKEGRNGRDYVSNSKVAWRVIKDGEFWSEYDRLKDAKAAYPDAVVVRD